MPFRHARNVRAKLDKRPRDLVIARRELGQWKASAGENSIESSEYVVTPELREVQKEKAMPIPFLMTTECMPTVEIHQDEIAIFATIKQNLRAMTQYANEVGDSISLYQGLSGSSKIQVGWSIIPPKQLIVSVYNYRMAMDAVFVDTTRRSKLLRLSLNMPLLERLRSSFKTRFPGTKEMRQAILHNAELQATKERIAETNLKENMPLPTDHSIVFGEGPASQCNLVDDTFQVTFAGNLYVIGMHTITAQWIFYNCESFIDAFEALGIKSRSIER